VWIINRDLSDAFAEKKSLWPKLIVFAFVLYIIYAILNSFGYIYEWTSGRMGMEKKKPAIEPKAAEPVKPAEEAK
jgi:hypothetical protein